MIRLILIAALFSAPVAAKPWVWQLPIASVTSFDVIGDTYVVGTAAGFHLVHSGQLELIESTVGPSIAAPTNEELAPHVLTTTYTDTGGLTHTIVTDCAKQTVDDCVRRHKRAVDTMVRAFPKQ